MEHDLVLEGRVVTPDGLRLAEVGVIDGKISQVGHGLKGTRRINTGRAIIFPGFVDMHVHLREPGWEKKEDFRTGSLAAVHGGVTSVVDMPNNPVPTTDASALEKKIKLAREKALVDVKFYGGVTSGNLGALKELKDAVGFKVYLSNTTGARAFDPSLLTSALQSIERTGKPVSLHCEDESILEKTRLRLKDGGASYSDLRPPEAEIESVKKVVDSLKSVRELGLNICHASVMETLDLVSAARAEKLRIHCEGTLHHLYFNRQALEKNPMLRTNPPLRSDQDRAALLDGVRTGLVSFLVTDHAPHLEDEKMESGLAGVPGLDDYSHIVTWLLVREGVDPAVISRLTSASPASFLGLEDRGEIVPGKSADFTIVDIHSPEVVKRDEIQSKCGWSPYEGKEFPGRARWTIVNGELLMDDYELVN